MNLYVEITAMGYVGDYHSTSTIKVGMLKQMIYWEI